jgi:DNA excision repair protein ERCC-4
MKPPPTFTIIRDTREQTPFNFGSWPVEEGTLQSGDYSIKHLEDSIAIERKSLPDLVGCIGRGRDRFERELHRLRGYRYAAVVVEATYREICEGNWRGQVTPAQVVGSIAAWRPRYRVDFIFADSHELAGEMTLLLMRKFFDSTVERAKRLIRRVQRGKC